MSSKKKVVAIAITTVALTAGSFGVASASPKSAKVTRTSITTVANNVAAGKLGRGAELSALLSTLVTKGTITQSQADAILAAANAAAAAHDALRPEMGAKGAGKGALAQNLTLIATTLGLDTPTVLSRLKAGETLANIAGGKKDALIAALVSDETKRIDSAVTAGKITAAQATAIKADLVAHVTAAVNATAPAGPKMGDRDERGGRGGKGERGHGPMGGKAPGAPGPLTLPAPTAPSN